MIEVSCSEPSPFARPITESPAFEPDIEWFPPGSATGVVISERHILTAAHLVRCPIIPTVHATLSNGRRVTVAVERDDVMFGQGDDIARLEMSSADNFGVDVAPPKLGHSIPGDKAAVAVVGKRLFEFGYFRGAQGLVDEIATRPGDSGAGVYNMMGELVGLVTGAGVIHPSIMHFQVVDERWLEGT